jgi:hypothetical protein
MAMTRVERARLLDGNWKVKASAGDYFKRQEVNMLDDVPKRCCAVGAAVGPRGNRAERQEQGSRTGRAA